MTDVMPRLRAVLAENPVAAIVIGTIIMLAAGEAISPGFALPKRIAGQLTVAVGQGLVAVATR